MIHPRAIRLLVCLVTVSATTLLFAQSDGGGTSTSTFQPDATITGSGTTNFIPRFTGATSIGNSVIFQFNGNIGINNNTPGARLDVRGRANIRDTITVFPLNGRNALEVSGSNFALDGTGKLHFAPGQTFPGAGTVTSVGSGAGLTGGPITHSGTLSIANGGVTNNMLQHSTITVNPGLGLTGGGTVPLGGSVTLNIDASKIAVGYSSTLPPSSSIPIGEFAALMLETGPLPTSGSYFVSASALPYVVNGDGYAFCYDTLASSGIPSQYGGGYQVDNYEQASISDVLFVSMGDSIQLWCYVGGENGSTLYNAGLTAALINTIQSKKMKTRHPRERPEQLHAR